MYNRESRDLEYDQANSDSSLKDSIYSREDMLESRQMPRNDSYDSPLDGNGGGA